MYIAWSAKRRGTMSCIADNRAQKQNDKSFELKKDIEAAQKNNNLISQQVQLEDCMKIIF